MPGDDSLPLSPSLSLSLPPSLPLSFSPSLPTSLSLSLLSACEDPPVYTPPKPDECEDQPVYTPSTSSRLIFKTPKPTRRVFEAFDTSQVSPLQC
jgi:hypothetical protein